MNVAVFNLSGTDWGGTFCLKTPCGELSVEEGNLNTICEQGQFQNLKVEEQPFSLVPMDEAPSAY
jgi:hypothetical protein